MQSPQRSSATVASAAGGKPLADPRRAVAIQGLDKSTLVDTLTSQFDMIDVDMNSLELIQCCRPLGASRLSDGEAEAIAGLFRALADPARVKIVNMLATRGKAVCACEFHPALGLSQATASHHLKKLNDAGLLEREQRGKWAYFSLNPEASARLAGLVDFPEVAR